eukprot:TRINITY_DN5578_c0_g1_i1.p1 TRINITY_DN5578_c0_g1~~TRINITY_DN5578_c0_g1_i1.p1  ORF type:complete len:595 (+),score=124.83 TRINITY_DN5578_c0_g1_i1:96-1880(+)
MAQSLTWLAVLLVLADCNGCIINSRHPEFGCMQYDLTDLAEGPFKLQDFYPDRYVAMAPCQSVPDSAVPTCVNKSCPAMIPTPMYQLYQEDGCISCGDIRSQSSSATDTGLLIEYTHGDACPATNGRQMAYNMICNTSVPASNPPEPLVQPGTAHGYEITWHTPLACGKTVPDDMCPPLPKPSKPQLNWQRDEIGVIIHYNMATQAGTQGCQLASPPDLKTFSMPASNATDQWAEAMVALGAKYAVYVAKHSCGFTTWPTKATLPNKTLYPYSIANSPASGRDIVADFVNSSRAKGIKPGFYYSVVTNAYLRVASGTVHNSSSVGPNQAVVTQEQYEDIVLAQVAELWQEYGQLGEIWFDGGYQASLKDNITRLLNASQPDAVAFGGYGVSANPVRWVGTEAGQAPYPNWCTGTANGGDPASPEWVPAEVDTTLQNNDQWFYNPTVGIRDLATMQTIYHGSVGRNGNLLLDFAPQPNGLLPVDAMAMYREFGDWIRSCYGQPLARTSGNWTKFTLSFEKPVGVDRIHVMEDLTYGQRVRQFTVSVNGDVALQGSSIGNKYIGLFDKEIAATSVVLEVGQSTATPVIREFAAFIC